MGPIFSLLVKSYLCFFVQMSAIFNDETGIEYVKKEGLHRKQSKMFLLREVFGPGNMTDLEICHS